MCPKLAELESLASMVLWCLYVHLCVTSVKRMLLFLNLWFPVTNLSISSQVKVHE